VRAARGRQQRACGADGAHQKKAQEKVKIFTTSGRKGGSYRLAHPDYRAVSFAVLRSRIASDLLQKSERDGGLLDEDRHKIRRFVDTYYQSERRLLEMDPLAGDKAASDQAAQHNAARVVGDDELAALGWRPPIDMLERLGLDDQWIQADLLARIRTYKIVPPGLAVFFCRKRSVDLGRLDKISDAIEEYGFEIVASLALDEEASRMLSETTRGGNWGAGPFPVGGGPPAHMFFAVDAFPVAPRKSLLTQHPFLDNEGTLSAKFFVRDKVLSGIPSSKQFNPVHYSDNSAETMHLAEHILPQEDLRSLSLRFNACRTSTAKLSEGFEIMEGDTPVAANLKGRAEKAGIIRKLFRRQYRDQVLPLVAIYQDLAQQWPGMPSIVGYGETYIDFEVGEDVVQLGEANRRLSIGATLRLGKILHTLADAGRPVASFNPAHEILVSKRDPKAVMPFFTKLSEQPAASPAPAGKPKTTRKEEAEWLRCLGLPNFEMLADHSSAAIVAYRVLLCPLRLAAIRAEDGFAKFKAKVKPLLRKR